jgi:hypothetical protein
MKTKKEVGTVQRENKRRNSGGKNHDGAKFFSSV